MLKTIKELISPQNIKYTKIFHSTKRLKINIEKTNLIVPRSLKKVLKNSTKYGNGKEKNKLQYQKDDWYFLNFSVHTPEVSQNMQKVLPIR